MAAKPVWYNSDEQKFKLLKMFLSAITVDKSSKKIVCVVGFASSPPEYPHTFRFLNLVWCVK